jgi:hypothetical protein
MSNSSYYKKIFIYILYLLIIITIFTTFLLQGHLHDINENWDKYKCNSYVIPFAGYIKENTGELSPSEFTNKNFIDCTSNIMYPISQVAVNTSMTPMIQSMTSTSGILQKSIRSSFDIVMKRFSGIFALMMGNVYDVIHSIMDQTKVLTNRIEFMIQRLGSIMTVIIYKLASLVKQQEAIFDYGLKLTKIILSIGLVVGVFNPPIMAFTLTMIGLTSGFLRFCFHPDSLIRLKSSKYIPMHKLKPGDKLYGNEIIRNIFYLEKINNSFLKFGNIYTTYGHKIYDHTKNKYVYACHHPKRKYIDSNALRNTNYIICFNTNTGSFYQNGHLISDYDNDPSNGWEDGIEHTMNIQLWNHNLDKYKLVPLNKIKIGDFIGLDKAKVKGIVHTLKSIDSCKTYIKNNKKKYIVGDDTLFLSKDGCKNPLRKRKHSVNYKDENILLITFITNKGYIEIDDGILLCDYEYNSTDDIVDPSIWD